MPNHTTTELELMGNTDEIKRFILNVDKGDGNHFSFESLLPMPNELITTVSPSRIVTQEQIDVDKAEYNLVYNALMEDERKLRDNYDPKGEHSFGITQETNDRFIKQYGVNNWYDWKVKNWGTKWGAYDTNEWDVSEGYANISYHTAWTPATAFIINVSKQFPLIKFQHSFADEGGSFLGIEIIQNGEVLDTFDFEWSSDNGIELRKNLGIWYDDDDE